MGKKTMAARYARALARVLERDEDLDRAEADLAAVADILERHPALARTLNSGALPRRRRHELLDKALRAAGAQAVTRRLLVHLAEERRLDLVGVVRAEFARACDARRSVVTAEVTTAVPAAGGGEELYRKALERMTGRRVRLSLKVDASILGGVVTRIGSRVYDGSVRGRMERLHARLRGEQAQHG